MKEIGAQAVSDAIENFRAPGMRDALIGLIGEMNDLDRFAREFETSSLEEKRQISECLRCCAAFVLATILQDPEQTVDIPGKAG